MKHHHPDVVRVLLAIHDNDLETGLRSCGRGLRSAKEHGLVRDTERAPHIVITKAGRAYLRRHAGGL